MGLFTRRTAQDQDDDPNAMVITAHPAAANTRRVTVVHRDTPAANTRNAGSNGRR